MYGSIINVPYKYPQMFKLLIQFIRVLQSNPRLHNQQDQGLTQEELDSLQIIIFKTKNREISQIKQQQQQQQQIQNQQKQINVSFDEEEEEEQKNNDNNINDNDNNNNKNNKDQDILDSPLNQNQSKLIDKQQINLDLNIKQNQNDEINKNQLQQEIEDNDKISCSICLMDFEDGKPCLKMPCNHLFHKDCVDHWLKKNIICPNCRSDVREALLYQKQPDNQNYHQFFTEKINEALEPSFDTDEYPEL